MDKPLKVCYKGQKHFEPIEIQNVKDNMYIVAHRKDQKVICVPSKDIKKETGV